mmetsp:Transcript_38970/g.103563  ORF Transcript_38970/g.103563 Transcript_38970/m.103563 type:complete len:133 (+) Transcript_38970:318-716(+)
MSPLTFDVRKRPCNASDPPSHSRSRCTAERAMSVLGRCCFLVHTSCAACEASYFCELPVKNTEPKIAEMCSLPRKFGGAQHMKKVTLRGLLLGGVMAETSQSAVGLQAKYRLDSAHNVSDSFTASRNDPKPF